MNKFEEFHVWSHGDPPVDKQTSTAENITFPQTMYAGCSNHLFMFVSRKGRRTEGAMAGGEDQPADACGRTRK